eukprot:1159063-Pelagomonas_calceolata.AAC.7
MKNCKREWVRAREVEILRTAVAQHVRHSTNESSQPCQALDRTTGMRIGGQAVVAISIPWGTSAIAQKQAQS